MIYLTNSQNTKDLCINLHNSDGYLQDAYSVKWKAVDQYGVQVAYNKAIKKDTGVYYTTWMTGKPGSYTITWEVQTDPCGQKHFYSKDVLVIDPSDLCKQTSKYNNPVHLLFKTYQVLGKNDLFVKITDSNNFPKDPYSISWRVINSKGCELISSSVAYQYDIGYFYAPWIINLNTGEYQIIWDFMESEDSPKQTASQNFSVVGSKSIFEIIPSSVCGTNFIKVGEYECSLIRVGGHSYIRCGKNLIQNYCINTCSEDDQVCPPVYSPMPTPNKCCDYEIPRQIHLSQQVLPINGAFTNQAGFPIPTGVRNISFYISYTRGAVGGYAAFKLMWSNGVEEIQETILDLDINDENTANVSQNLYLQNLNGPEPTDDNTINFVIHTKDPGGSTFVRLLAAEKGNIAFPGTIQISLTAST